MIKATVTTSTATITKYFDTIGHAIQWSRGFLFDVIGWKIYDANGNLYYGN